jgi:hypothetical protein
VHRRVTAQEQAIGRRHRSGPINKRKHCFGASTSMASPLRIASHLLISRRRRWQRNQTVDAGAAAATRGSGTDVVMGGGGGEDDDVLSPAAINGCVALSERSSAPCNVAQRVGGNGREGRRRQERRR